jgi:hypothetical protein
MILQAKDIDISSVTDTQIGACHKVIHQGGNYYLVENSRGEIDPETGYIKEYKVSWAGKTRGFQCQCEAAYHGKLCWHIRASVAAAAEERAAIAELQAAICAPVAPVATTYSNIDVETRARVAAACERQASKPASKARPYPVKGFSLLK